MNKKIENEKFIVNSHLIAGFPWNYVISEHEAAWGMKKEHSENMHILSAKKVIPYNSQINIFLNPCPPIQEKQGKI